MAYIRNKDISKVGKSVVGEGRGVILTKVKHGFHKKVRAKVPTYNYKGKIMTKPKKRV